MAIQYLSGNRATGTASERTGLTTYSTKSWVELGRTTVTSSTNDVVVSGLNTTDYPFLMVLNFGVATGGTVELRPRYNADSGSNYAGARSYNGGSDNQAASQANIDTSEQFSGHALSVVYINNGSTIEKLAHYKTVNSGSSGASNAPNRMEGVLKWANTDTVTSYATHDLQAGTFDVGSEIVVLGSKKSGTNTDKAGFWQELADVSVSSGSLIDTGTIASKKYLYLELYTVPNGTSYSFLRFNSDETANYNSRYDTNGTSEQAGSSGSEDGILFYAPTNDTERYMTAFIINKSDKEKLVIGEGVAQNTTGSGSSNIPERRALYGKWANTSDSITSIQVDSKNGAFAAGTRLKVWGSD